MREQVRESCGFAAHLAEGLGPSAIEFYVPAVPPLISCHNSESFPYQLSAAPIRVLSGFIKIGGRAAEK